MPEEDDVAPRRLDDEKIEAILAACPDEHRLTVELALATGLRWSELMRLTWSQVVWSPKPKLLVEGTKGRRKAHKRRIVPLDPEITMKLQEARTRATSLMVIENQPWNSWVIRRSIKAKTGIAFRFHDLRHTFAARYIEDRGSLAMLQEILGHSSLKMVMRYAKPTENAVQEDADRVFLSRVCSKTCSKSGEAFGPQP
jgi:integrase